MVKKIIERLVIYIDVEKKRRLKAKLALLGKSLSMWFREVIDDFLREK